MQEKIKIKLPLFKTLQTYPTKWLRRDLIAGITVASIAIPQAMAYAQLAGVPIAMGLYAALMGMIAFAFFSTTRFVNVGPDAAMAALAGATVIPLAGGNMERAGALVVILSIFIGIICIIAVYARLGFIAEFLSRPILLGYMAGLALAVIASQAPKIFGLPAPLQTNFFGSVNYIITNISNYNWEVIAFSASVLSLGILLPMRFKKLPVALVILVGATLISMAVGFIDNGIPVLGVVPTGLPFPHLPAVKPLDIQNLVVPALAISVIGYANTIAIARSFAAKKNEEISANQEFVGLGASNIASGLFGGIPVSASASRSAVNFDSHAKTQVAQIFGAATIALSLIFLAPFLKYLPVSALAIIIILAAAKLFDYSELKAIWKAWHSEAILAIITVLGVTFLGIFQGLLLAVLLAIINLVRRTAFPQDAILGIASNGAFRDMSRPPKTQAIEGLLIYRFDAPLFFGNASYFRERVLNLVNNNDTTVKWFLWDAETITSIDSTAAKMLEGLIADLKAKGVILAVARMKGTVRTTISHTSRLSGYLQRAPHFTSLGLALEAYKEKYATKPPGNNNKVMGRKE